MILSAEADRAINDWGYIKAVLQRGASDIHLSAGSPPTARIHGSIVMAGGSPLTREQVDNLVKLLTDNYGKSQFFGEKPEDLDFTIEVPSLQRRLRVNIFRQYHGPSIVMRILADKIKTFEELGLPKQFEKMAMEKNGLVLVTGGTGSGKSTTLAALLNIMNQRRPLHIITVEDPIEIIFQNNKCLIEQRQVGTDVPDFATALRSALRESPDVILVGEIRDSTTAMMALKAAQVGVLVLATLHTRNAAETISRYLSMFEDNYRGGARSQLADALRGVMCQSLILNKAGDGRVAAVEVMLGTNAVKHMIRDDRTHLLHSMMEIAAHDGMITMEQSLVKLFQSGQIDLQVAFDNSNDKDSFLAQIDPELHKHLQIEWETEMELKNLEKLKETRKRQLAQRTV